MCNVALLALCCGAAWTTTIGGAHGQSALDGFDPGANGPIHVIVTQPDGKILIGGDFTSLAPNGGAPVTRNRIARLNVDGTVDQGFDPNSSAAIRALAVQPDGKVLAGGNIMTIGGQPRPFLARLDGVTGAADSFVCQADGGVSSIIVQSNGKVLVGGLFFNFGGKSRKGIARFDAATGVVDSFNPDADQPVLCLAVQADGKILVAGGIRNVGGQARNYIARLDPVTGAADSFNPDADGLVRSLAVQADGTILAGGQFTFIGGQSRNRIARLDPETGLADSFDPNPNGAVSAIAVASDGKILVGGSFSGANSIGGQTRNGIARLDPASGMADAFDPNTSGPVQAITVQRDGKVLIGGSFTGWNSVGSQTRNNIARLEIDGRVDQTLDARIVGYTVYATALQPDGKIVIGGEFTSVFGQPRNNIARLNTDGTVDPTFNPGANASVTALAVQPDGKIIAGGNFTTIGGQTRRWIARLDPVTGLVDSFDPNATASVSVIALAPDGKILVGGGFFGTGSIGGASRNYIARLDPQSGLADSFDPGLNGPPYTLAVDGNGKILVGGHFTTVGGQPRNYIARLDPITGQADSFAPNASSAVYSIAVQPDEKILAAGVFTLIGGQTRNRIARLDPTTGLADSFNPDSSGAVFAVALQADRKIVVSGFFTGSIGGQIRNRIARLDPMTGLADAWNPNADNAVHAMSIQPDGKVVVGGSFGLVGGQLRTTFARLTNDTVSSHELVVSPTTVTWARSGSAPQFARVTFESSLDSLNYTPLGTGSVASGNWTLGGLSLPIGQNFYVRARGYYTSGVANASYSLAESVRNVHLVAPPLSLVSAASRKTHGAAGVFDIQLPLSGEPAVECRSSNGTHSLLFTFTNELVSGTASVTTGTAHAGDRTVSGNIMTVNLSDVVDAQNIIVTLSGVTDNFGQVLPDTTVTVNMLVGDINGSKGVNASDIGAVKAQSGATVTASNFRTDVALSGGITASDIALVKSRSGQTVP